MAKEYILLFDYALYKEDTGGAVFKPKYVRELVRCKDCKWWKEPYCFKNGDLYTRGADWFCADGKRKEQDDE